MSITLGEKLRQAREERGISISEVAEQTRISPMYLESIENDNYKPLPGGIFNKGFVKAYAKYVGLDEQEALHDYSRLVAQHEAIVEEAQPRYRPEVLTDEARFSSTMIPTIVFAVIILALMTGGLLFVVNYIKNQPDTPTAANSAANNAANVATNIGTIDTNPTPAPVLDQIRVEFAALSEKVSVTSTVDGALAYDEVTPDAPKTYTAQQGLKLRYYRGFADKVRITVNGKEIAAPQPPAKGNIEFEINRENVAQIMESGRIVSPEAAATQAAPTVTATPHNTPAATATPAPRPSATPVRPNANAAATPRKTPTPNVVGRPPETRPSPN